MRAKTIFRVAVFAVLALLIVSEEAASNGDAGNKGEAMPMQSNVPKIMDILIHSLYTNRNIFLREIISNASDALDKIRFMYIKDPKTPKNDAGEEPTMDIRIRVDKKERTFVMQDGGVGMTKDEMQNVLSSLGSSGTEKFLENVKAQAEGGDSNLIGQFGVGFYSVFLVADRVRVASKSDNSDKQWVWESTGSEGYFLYEDPRGNTLGRGTELTLELKKDADEYLEGEKIKEIIHRHSEFIHFPIYVQTTTMEPAPKEETADEPAAAAEKKDDAEEGDVKEEGEEKKEEEPKMIEKTKWDLVNENKPIWTRAAKEITEEEYNKFYKALTKDYDDPMYYTHFTAEGEVAFKALLFVPGRAPYNVFDTSVAHNNIRLYVRRVFITDEFRDLLPRYLNFIKGVVDSDDLPLHVSRELLQENRILKIVKKRLVRKALAMLERIAENDKELKEKEEKKDGDKDADEEDEEDAAAKKTAGTKYSEKIQFPTFWEEFGKNLRLGMIEDGTNRAKLTKLLRYKTSKSNDTLVSLDEYVERMPEKQKGIYFLTGESMEKIKQSPVLEDATKRDVEVIFMTDAIDEYVVGHVTDYDDKKLINLAKDTIDLGDSSKDKKKIEKKREEKYEKLTQYLKSLVGERVQRVTLTKRTTSEPFLLSSPQHGVSATMARIMKAQTLGEKNADSAAKQVLEVNHLHPLVNEIFTRVETDEKDKTAEEIALVLYDTAALQNGFEIEDALAFGRRVGRLLRRSVDIAPDQGLLEEDLSEYKVDDEEDEEEEAAADSDKKAEDADESEDKKEDL